MTGKHEHFNRQHQGLYSQNGCVYNTNGVDHMPVEVFTHTEFSRCDEFMVVGIGVGEAFSAGEYAIKPTWVQRLQGDCNGARLGSVLNESQLKNYPR